MAAPPAIPLGLKDLTDEDKEFLEKLIRDNPLDSKEKEQVKLLPWKQKKIFPFYRAPGSDWDEDLDMISSYDGKDYLSRKLKVIEAAVSSVTAECVILPVTLPISHYFQSEPMIAGGKCLQVDCAQQFLKRFKKGSAIMTKSYSLNCTNIMHYIPPNPFNYQRFLSNVFQTALEQKQHYIAIPGSYKNYQEEGNLLLRFLKQWVAHNAWAIERVVILADKTQKDFYNRLLEENWFQSQERLHKELPPLEPATLETHLGPTNSCNWVIRNRLIAGAYPGSRSPEEHEKIMESIINEEISSFVCLQTPGELKRFISYENSANKYASVPDDIRFITFPIGDGSTVAEREVRRLVVDLAWRLYYTNENIYVHCWGGHGRTGTIIGSLIGKLFGLDSKEALKRTSDYHKMRIPVRSRSPQTHQQCEQVISIVDDKSFQILD